MNRQIEYQIEYYNEKIQKTLLLLPAGLLARYIRLTDLMEEFGPNLGMPHTKALGDKLFELCLKSKESPLRNFVFCMFAALRSNFNPQNTSVFLRLKFSSFL